MSNDTQVLRATLETALARIEDMLADDDGQAFKEARKFLESARQLAEQPGFVMVPVEDMAEIKEALDICVSLLESARSNHLPRILVAFSKAEAIVKAENCDCPAKDMPFGRCCKARPLTASPTAPSTEQGDHFPDAGNMVTAPAEASEPVGFEEIEAMATNRYKVVPSHESMFHRFAVVAGDGTQQLYLGREVECQNMAAKFTGAFLDGAFAALKLAARTTPPPAPVLLSDAEINAIYDDTPSGKPGPFILRFARAIEQAVIARVGRGEQT